MCRRMPFATLIIKKAEANIILSSALKLNMIAKIILLIIVPLAVGCTNSRKVDENEIKTSSEVLNKYINSAPFQAIDITKSHKKVVHLTPKNIIYSIHNFTGEHEPILGHIKSAIRVGESFYVSDMATKSIYKINDSGSLSGPLIRKGKGPGELDTTGELFFNSGYIYVPDYNNGRINRYTHNMETKRALGDFLMQDIAVSEEYIFGTNRNSQGFEPQKPGEGLIVISSTKSLSDTVKTILPRIIPEGYQPQVYNSVRFAVNRRGRVITSYSPLPWIFIFDKKFEHKNTLILNHTAFDSLDIAEMKLFKPRGNKGYGGQTPINSFTYLNNGDIFLTLREELVHISKVKNSYKVKNRIKFKNDFNVKPSKWTWTFNKVIDMVNDTVYVHNPQYLFWFEI